MIILQPVGIVENMFLCNVQLVGAVRTWLHKKLVQDFKIVIKWIIKSKVSSFKYVYLIYEKTDNEKVIGGSKSLSCIQTFAEKQI